MTDALGVERPAPGVLLVRIQSQPLGALTNDTKEVLEKLIATEEDRGETRAAVIIGAGRAFSVGADIKEFTQDAAWLSASAVIEHRLMDRLESAGIVSIAACNGLTLGGGAELALACDVRVAAKSARFGFPEVSVGAFASGGASQRLPQHIGLGNARYLLLTGAMIDADRAYAVGLVQEVVEDEELEARALSIAASVAAHSRESLRATKRCVYAGVVAGRAVGSVLERELAVQVGIGADAAEGKAAFLQKRVPQFSANVRHGRRVDGRRVHRRSP